MMMNQKIKNMKKKRKKRRRIISHSHNKPQFEKILKISINDLPSDCIIEIISFLSDESKWKFSRICKLFHIIITQSGGIWYEINDIYKSFNIDPKVIITDRFLKKLLKKINLCNVRRFCINEKRNGVINVCRSKMIYEIFNRGSYTKYELSNLRISTKSIVYILKKCQNLNVLDVRNCNFTIVDKDGEFFRNKVSIDNKINSINYNNLRSVCRSTNIVTTGNRRKYQLVQTIIQSVINDFKDRKMVEGLLSLFKRLEIEKLKLKFLYIDHNNHPFGLMEFKDLLKNKIETNLKFCDIENHSGTKSGLYGSVFSGATPIERCICDKQSKCCKCNKQSCSNLSKKQCPECLKIYCSYNCDDNRGSRRNYNSVIPVNFFTCSSCNKFYCNYCDKKSLKSCVCSKHICKYCVSKEVCMSCGSILCVECLKRVSFCYGCGEIICHQCFSKKDSFKCVCCEKNYCKKCIKMEWTMDCCCTKRVTTHNYGIWMSPRIGFSRVCVNCIHEDLECEDCGLTFCSKCLSTSRECKKCVEKCCSKCFIKRKEYFCDECCKGVDHTEMKIESLQKKIEELEREIQIKSLVCQGCSSKGNEIMFQCGSCENSYCDYCNDVDDGLFKVCDSCGELFCKKCQDEIENCISCDNKNCKSCSEMKKCSNCFNNVCSACFESFECQNCDNIYCSSDCSMKVQCSLCAKSFCSLCKDNILKTCSDCDDKICNECSEFQSSISGNSFIQPCSQCFHQLICENCTKSDDKQSFKCHCCQNVYCSACSFSEITERIKCTSCEKICCHSCINHININNSICENCMM